MIAPTVTAVTQLSRTPDFHTHKTGPRQRWRPSSQDLLAELLILSGLCANRGIGLFRMRKRAQLRLHLLLHHLPLGCRSRFPLRGSFPCNTATLSKKIYPSPSLPPPPFAALPSTSSPVVTSRICPNSCLLETFPGSINPSLRCARSHASSCRPFLGVSLPPRQAHF